MIFDFLRSKPSYPPVDILSAATRDSIIASQLRKHLPQLGLQEAAPRRWIDGSKPPVRRLFLLELLKGASMTASWGFSLDFVPHISAGAVRWHRSDKTAMLDVIVNPKSLLQPCSLYGTTVLEDELQKLMPSAAAAAAETWRRGATYEGMIAIIRDIRDQKSNCHGYYTYTQLPLAHAFLLAKTGALDAARSELDAYLAKHDFRLTEEAPAKLKMLVDEAAPAR